jgi:hypothetical protein
MPERSAGSLGGGGTRTYEFTATLPEGGEPNFQNAVQGASTTVAYSWVPSARRVAKVRWASKAVYPLGPQRVRLRIPRSMRA